MKVTNPSNASTAAVVTFNEAPSFSIQTYVLNSAVSGGTLVFSGGSNALIVDLSGSAENLTGFTSISMATANKADKVTLSSDQIGSDGYKTFTGTLTDGAVDDSIAVSAGTGTSATALDLSGVTSSNVVFDASAFTGLKTLTLGDGHTVKLGTTSYSSLPTITGGDETSTVILSKLAAPTDSNPNVAPSAAASIPDYALELGSGSDWYQPSSEYATGTTDASATVRGQSVSKAIVAGGDGLDYILYGKTMFAGAISSKSGDVYAESVDNSASGAENSSLKADNILSGGSTAYIENTAAVDALTKANVLVAGETFYASDSVAHTSGISQDVICSNVSDTIMMLQGNEGGSENHPDAVAPKTLNVHQFGNSDSIIALNLADDVPGTSSHTPFILIQEGTSATSDAVGTISSGLTYSGGKLTIDWDGIKVKQTAWTGEKAINSWSFTGGAEESQSFDDTVINFLGKTPSSFVITLLGDNGDDESQAEALYSLVLTESA